MRSTRAPARAHRLRTPEQFAAVAGERATWRATRQWIAASARVEASSSLAVPQAREAKRQQATPQYSGDSVETAASAFRFEPAVGVRFGFTVGRRQARRAVQRVMVKRVMREAARNAVAAVSELAADRSVDVVLRLRSPLPDPSQMSLAGVKRTLRAEADSLIDQLVRHLRAAAR